MRTLLRISELDTAINNAKTFEAEGRQIVIDACKELYNLVEADYYIVGAEELIEDMYNDLTSGNFSEPFLCEKKKEKFELYKTIYVKNVHTKLDTDSEIFEAK